MGRPLLYGGGDFARTVEIATMAGRDTDCNAGNVGTVLGVARGLEGLPEKYRAVIHLFYHEDYAVEEISGILRRPEGTVKSQLNRGKKLLKNMLQEEWNGDE